MERFFAKLLFQFRKTKKGKEQKRRVCEERIITILAKSAEEAYKKAVTYGKDEAWTEAYHGVKLDFIGILEMDSLTEEDKIDNIDEVYWKLVELLKPMERKSQLVPQKKDLYLFRDIKQPDRRIKLY